MLITLCTRGATPGWVGIYYTWIMDEVVRHQAEINSQLTEVSYVYAKTISFTPAKRI